MIDLNIVSLKQYGKSRATALIFQRKVMNVPVQETKIYHGKGLQLLMSASHNGPS